jgi:DNA invertase Pin-like site-specific DNA recombinase
MHGKKRSQEATQMAKRTCPFTPGSRVWGYGRDSGGIEQQESVASQRKAIQEYCRRYNLVLVHFFADEARIGSTTIGRDALEDLLYMARREAQTVDGIIFWSFSRLARDQLDSQFIKADLRRRVVGRPRNAGYWKKLVYREAGQA